MLKKFCLARNAFSILFMLINRQLCDKLDLSPFGLFQKLLQMWIKYQSMEDKDREKFLDSVWAIAKISSSTDQVNQLVTGLVKKVRVIYDIHSITKCISLNRISFHNFV